MVLKNYFLSLVFFGMNSINRLKIRRNLKIIFLFRNLIIFLKKFPERSKIILKEQKLKIFVLWLIILDRNLISSLLIYGKIHQKLLKLVILEEDLSWLILKLLISVSLCHLKQKLFFHFYSMQVKKERVYLHQKI